MSNKPNNQLTCQTKELIPDEKYKIIVNMGYDPVTDSYPRKSRVFYGTAEEADIYKDNLVFELTFIEDHQELLNEFGDIIPGLDEFYKFGPDVIDKLNKGYSLYDAWVLLNKDAAPQEELSTETVGEWFDFWLDNDAKVMFSWEKNTERRHRGIVKHNIKPNIGHIVLPELKASHILEMFVKLGANGGRHGKPLSKRSIIYVYTILNQGLKQAVARGKIKENPAQGLRPANQKGKAHKKWVVLDTDQLDQFIKDIEGNRDYFEIFVDSYTGLRQSELLGLTWEKFLPNQFKIKVTQALHKTYEEEEEFELRDRTKNDTSTRDVDITEHVVSALNLHKRNQMAKGISVAPDALIFTEADGSPKDSDNLSSRYSKLAAKHGHKGMSFHHLRHTHATILLSNGAFINEVAERLGHADPRITFAVYGHVLPKRPQTLAVFFDNLMEKATKTWDQDGIYEYLVERLLSAELQENDPGKYDILARLITTVMDQHLMESECKKSAN